MPQGSLSARNIPNGGAAAAFLAAGIGAFATGLVVLLNEAGVLSVPALFAPAGGVTGRTTLAVVIWLMAWALLHARWRGRDVESRRVGAVTWLLTGLGVLSTFPPVWALF